LPPIKVQLREKKFNEFLESVSGKIGNAKEKVSDYAEQAKAKAEEYIHDTKTSKV
jgi:ElaB/YqjD/DUF883 family membrane-anchored ribosome-binding protein